MGACPGEQHGCGPSFSEAALLRPYSSAQVLEVPTHAVREPKVRRAVASQARFPHTSRPLKRLKRPKRPKRPRRTKTRPRPRPVSRLEGRSLGTAYVLCRALDVLGTRARASFETLQRGPVARCSNQAKAGAYNATTMLRRCSDSISAARLVVDCVGIVHRASHRCAVTSTAGIMWSLLSHLSRPR